MPELPMILGSLRDSGIRKRRNKTAFEPGDPKGAVSFDLLSHGKAFTRGTPWTASGHDERPERR
jgi:hypothetical protein